MLDQLFRSYLRLNVFGLRTRSWFFVLRTKYYIMRKLLYSSVASRLRSIDGVPASVKRQRSLIRERKFDTLIILDACRYDVFSNVVSEYLDGVLEPVVSPASVTIEWLKSVWGDRTWRDIVYVSASPMVNKRGLLREFDARGKFLDVIEVWDWGWDEDLSTVPPDKVNFGTRMTLAKMKLRRLRYPWDYKLVIHYVQPHAPYRALQRVVSKIVRHEELSKEIVDVTVRKLGKFAGRFSIDYILLGVLREYVKSSEKIEDIMRRLYEDNLRWVLGYVADLVPRLGGKVVITADHGELLGEYGLYFHMDIPLPYLRLVPWFIVKQ